MMPDTLFVPIFIDTNFHLSSSCIFCRLQAVHVKKPKKKRKYPFWVQMMPDTFVPIFGPCGDAE